jgi:hypothetical protein
MPFPWSAGNILTAADLDAALGGTQTSYTPALGGAGWALGSTGASADGAYTVIGYTVFFWVRLVFGTVGATFAATVPTVSLPVNADASMVAYTPRGGAIVGSATDVTAGPASFPLEGELTATNVALMCNNAAGTYVTHAYVSSTAPHTWQVSDVIRLNGWYRKT